MNNTLDDKYLGLLDDIMSRGKVKKDRTGVGTVSLFSHEMRVDLSEGLSLLTTKYVHHPAVIHELLWFLMGGTDIKYLVDNNVRIWNEWPFKRYCNTPLEKLSDTDCIGDASRVRRHFTMEEYIQAIRNDGDFAKRHGQVGKVYGSQWINWTWPVKNAVFEGDTGALSFGTWRIDGYNQIAKLVETLKTNPDSRRMIVTAWNPPEMDDSALPCCHYGFQCYTSELELDVRNKLACEKLGIDRTALHNRFVEWIGQMDYMASREHIFYDELGIPKRSLSLKWIQRSTDVFLGLPFDIASYSILTHMLCKQLNFLPNELIVSSADTHIYLNHFDQVKEQLSRRSSPYSLPTLILKDGVDDVQNYRFDDVQVVGYICHPAIKAPIAV